jgi:FtsH-binding integral membrane protein
MTNDFELENMRQQMATLKNKLNEQEILNDRIMRRSMKKEVSNITRRYNIIMAIGVLMVPYGYWCFVKLAGLSIFFWIVTSIFMLICTGATFYNSRKISDPGLMNHNLVEARKKVASAKKFESNWLLFGVPAVILWMGWFLYEIYQIQGGDLNNGFFWGGCVGGIIGAICGIKMHFKTQHQYQDIIDQIEDLTNDK